MLICKMCKFRIGHGDDYAKDGDDIICMDCIEDHVLCSYDIFDICNCLDIDILECQEEPEEQEKPEPPIPGQVDIFDVIGGILK